jgi:hypothetical protein
MIATKLHVEYFRSEEKLFAFIDRVLEKNGLYNIDHDGGWFILSYWFDHLYKVMESDHKLVLRLGTHHYGQDVRLYWGDVLVLDAVSVDRSWFYYPRLLIGKREKLIICARGFTPLGNVFALVRAGVLRQIEAPDGY